MASEKVSPKRIFLRPERPAKRQCAGITWTDGTGEGNPNIPPRSITKASPNPQMEGIPNHKMLVLGYVPGACWKILGKMDGGESNWKWKSSYEQWQNMTLICSDFVYPYVLGEWTVCKFPNLTWLRFLKWVGKKTPTSFTKKVKDINAKC